METLIKIESYWQKEPPNAEPCFVCDDQMYGGVNKLYFEICGRIDESTICICNNCYDALNGIY